ncbi:MAG: hypothetical protein IJV98_00580 [Clostridia bacterium]|nr:hypothetical protein [Clostridia bacterium]
MKNTRILTKLAAFVLVLCLGVSLFASCGSDDVMMSMEIDGKTYTLTEKEFATLLKIKKIELCVNLGLSASYDNDSFWLAEMEEGGTREDYYMDMVLDQAKVLLIEKYLFDKYQLTLSAERMAEYETVRREEVDYLGGKGSYKQYYGYTVSEYFDTYVEMVERSNAIYEFLCDENGEQKVTEEDLAKYYEENYAGYQYIVLDMNNKVVRDEDGNRVVNKKKTTDENGETVEVDGDSYKTEALTDEEKSEKQTLAAKILAELEAGTKTFEELVAEYSDEYYSVEYPEGSFVPKGSAFANETVISKIEDLEIGEYTEEAISVNSNAYQYIVKRVELKEAVYHDDHYLSLFDGYEEVVKTDKYENYVKTYFDKVVVVQAVAGRYSLVDLYHSEHIDYLIYINMVSSGS